MYRRVQLLHRGSRHIQLFSVPIPSCNLPGRCQATKALPSHLSLSTLTRTYRRYNSSPAQPPDSLPSSSITRPRPFAIEHVDGREQHLSWSPEGGITREWREADAEMSKETTAGSAISTAVSSSVGGIASWFRQMFLPTNYPQSVHRS